MQILPDKLEPFDLAIAYRKGFPHPRLVQDLDNALLQLQESGTLTVRFPVPTSQVVLCTRAHRGIECLQSNLSSARPAF